MADKTSNDVPNPEDEQWVKLGWTKDSIVESRVDQESNTECFTTSAGINQESVIDRNNEGDESERTTLTSRIENVLIDENKELDESDDISVIAESEIESNDANDLFVDTIEWKHKFHDCLKFYNVEQISQIGVTKTLLIACSLGMLIGLFAGYIFNVGAIISSKTDLDLRNMEATNNRLINNLQDLSEVKSIVNEIKENLLPGMIFKEQLKEIPDDLKKIEKISHFLYSMFNIIDEMNPLTTDMRTQINKTHNTIEQLQAFQRIISQSIKELNTLENSSQAKFLHNVNDKINQMYQSSVDDCSETLMKLNMRLHKKINNFRSNLNKRLYKIKSSENPQFVDVLRRNNLFLENCEITDGAINVDTSINNKQNKKARMRNNIIKPPSSINCENIKSNKYLLAEDSCFMSQKSNPKQNYSNSSPITNNSINKNNIPVNNQTSKENPRLNISKLEVPIQQEKINNKNKNTSKQNEFHQDRTNYDSKKLKIEKRKIKLKPKDNINSFGNDFNGLKKAKKQNQKVLFKRNKANSVNDNENQGTKFSKNRSKNSLKNEEQEEDSRSKRKNPSFHTNWQFQRSLAREERRTTNSEDVINWYLQRAYSRRRA